MPSPFSCFSPSYSETLPRNYNNKSPQRSDINSLFNNSSTEFGINSSNNNSPKPIRFEDYSNRRNGNSLDYTNNNSNNNSAGNNLMAKRKSYRSSPNPKRISKDIIGSPYNFIHEGHVGKPLDLSSAKELQSTLDSVTAALSSPNLARHSSPSFPTSSLPILSVRNSLPVAPPHLNSTRRNANKPLPLPSISSPPALSSTSNGNGNRQNARPISTSNSKSNSDPSQQPPVIIIKRKAPPPVTASVIRQAGPQAVYNSSSSFSASTPAADPILTNPQLVEKVPEPSMSELGIIPDSRLGGNRAAGGYMTETTKGKWSAEMRAIEDALKF